MPDGLSAIDGAAVVPELTGSPPPNTDPGPWFVGRHAAAWAYARDLASTAPLVVIDGDPFKGLWYSWVYDDAATVAVVAAAYATEVARGRLSFPDLYVVLQADEAELRRRRDGDSTRTRRSFELHLRLIEPQRRYFEALAQAAPGSVIWLSGHPREEMVGTVLAAVAGPAIPRPDATRLLTDMARWVASHSIGAPA